MPGGVLRSLSAGKRVVSLLAVSDRLARGPWLLLPTRPYRLRARHHAGRELPTRRVRKNFLVFWQNRWAPGAQLSSYSLWESAHWRHFEPPA